MFVYQRLTTIVHDCWLTILLTLCQTYGNVTNRKNWLSLPKKTIIHKEEKHCVYCSSTDLVKNGKCPGGSQRWRCNSCKKGFRFDYRYNACKQGVREKIIEMPLNGSGVRDVGRVLKISRDTVCPVLKTENPVIYNHIYSSLLFELSSRLKA